MAVQDLERIEQKIDRVTAGAVAISDSVGGVLFSNMAEVMEFAKLMSLAQNAVPGHLRGNPGACLAVVVQALEWRMSPFAVANQSYEVNSRIAYQSMLIHAVIEARAPLKQRLKERYEGEGPTRKCFVVGHIKGELEPREVESPELQKIKVKNSPLWSADPDQQLFYYTSRTWARRHCPDVLLGIYAEEELRESNIGAENAINVTPKPDVGTRLKGGTGKRGFQADNVKQIEAQPAPPAVPMEPVTTAPQEPVQPQTDLASEAADEQAEAAGEAVQADEAAREAEPEWMTKLRDCHSVSAVDRLEKEIGATLSGDNLTDFVDACTARAGEIMAKKKK